jgi:hypothetical protein
MKLSEEYPIVLSNDEDVTKFVKAALTVLGIKEEDLPASEGLVISYPVVLSNDEEATKFVLELDPVDIKQLATGLTLQTVLHEFHNNAITLNKAFGVTHDQMCFMLTLFFTSGSQTGLTFQTEFFNNAIILEEFGYTLGELCYMVTLFFDPESNP